jgi:hypothetical protein
MPVKSLVTAPKTINFTNDKDGLALIARRAELKQIEAAGVAAEKERKEVEAAIRERMGDAETITVRGIVALKLSSERKTIKWDHDALKLGWPEAFDAIRSEHPYRFLQ